jgi:hypothetical protein
MALETSGSTVRSMMKSMLRAPVSICVQRSAMRS